MPLGNTQPRHFYFTFIPSGLSLSNLSNIKMVKHSFRHSSNDNIFIQSSCTIYLTHGNFSINPHLIYIYLRDAWVTLQRINWLSNHYYGDALGICRKCANLIWYDITLQGHCNLLKLLSYAFPLFSILRHFSFRTWIDLCYCQWY